MALDTNWVYQGEQGETLIAAPGEPALNITAYTAAQKVSGYVASKISHLMKGETPALVFSQGRLVWRVPIVLATPIRGLLGVVGTLDVDARTGQLLVDPTLTVQLESRAQALIAGTPPPPAV
ncbi:MAG: hypothetical protein IT329_11115 [Caldilineaceae bacterium]|nr:hypothetical protein [Caldilineaceae bacterium]